MKNQTDDIENDNILPTQKKLQQEHKVEEIDPTIFGDWQHKGKVTDF